VAAETLLRLARLTGETRFEEAAGRALSAVQGLFTRAPSILGHALSAFDLSLSPPREIAFVGDPAGRDLLAREAWRRFLQTGGVILNGGDTIVVRLNRRTYSPVLRQADVPEVAVPWWGGRRLRFEYT
jgi:uncharacterized protein YyaL (SSP411 family)